MVQGSELENVRECHSRAGRAYVVAMFVFFVFKTGDTVAFVIPEMGVTDADFGLKIPMRRENPIVAVAESASGQIAVEAFGSESSEELCSVEMYSYEVTFEALAKPIFCFWLHEPEFHLLVVLEGPGIVGPGKLHSPFGSYPTSALRLVEVVAQ